MSKEPVNEQLNVLVQTIASLPTDAQAILCEPLEQLNSALNRRIRILKLVQDALSQLRLDMKYLMFDLEATRRERDEYKRKLEEK